MRSIAPQNTPALQARRASILVPIWTGTRYPCPATWALGMILHCNLLDFVPSIGLWGLVNNAGKLSVGMIELQPLDSFKRISDVNLWGTIFVTQTFLPLVKKARGRIVNIGSILGEIMITMKTLEVKTRNSSMWFGRDWKRSWHRLVT